MKFTTNQHTSTYRLSNYSVLRCCLTVAVIFLLSCDNNDRPPPQQELVNTPEQMKDKIPDVIGRLIAHIVNSAGRMDSITILQQSVVQYLYDKTNNAPKWSTEAQWSPIADSLMNFIRDVRLYGLFPSD